MEIKAKLNKPCTEEQRIDFIAYYCQNCQGTFDENYELRETESEFQAWGHTEEEKQSRAKEARKKELIAELDVWDLKQIRSLAAKAAGTATEEDEAKLAEIEQKKKEIRQKIKELDEPDL